MRIAVLSLHTSPAAQPGAGDAGGLNVYVAATTEALRRAGHEVVVFTTAPEILEPRTEHLPSGIPVHVLPRHAEDKVALHREVPALARAIAAHPDFRDTDLVWAHYWISALAALDIRDGSATPGTPQVAVTFHTIGAVKDRDTGTPAEPQVRLDAEAQIASAADVLVANTPAEAADMHLLLGADPDRTLVAPPGVDLHTFTPGPMQTARADLGRTADDLLVLCVGRMQYVKGTDVAIDALAALRSDDPALAARVRLVVLGGASGGVDAAAFAELARDMGIADLVEFLPPVPPHELARWYRAADLVVVPSRSESFGFVAAEAQAAGVPVLATAVGGLPHVVEAGRTGLLVEGTDPHVWAQALAALLRDPAQRARMGAAAHAHAAVFDWTTCVDRVLTRIGIRAPESTRNGEPRDRHHAQS